MATALIAATLLGACGSSGGGGGGDQTEDDFLDIVDATCRAATREIEKLDATDDGAIEDLRGQINSVHDDLEALTAPKSLANDFDDFVANLDSQIDELRLLDRAVGGGDTEAIGTSVAEINGLRSAADELAGDLGALKCKNLTPADGLAPSVTVDTTGTSTVDNSTVDTGTVDTTGTSTVDTPSTDTGTSTVTTDALYPDDLSAGLTPPEGYRWIDIEPVDVSGLYEKPIVGPLVEYYGAGRVESLEDGHTASIYLLSITEEWTPEAIAEYQFWEGVENGTDTTTPGGVPVRQAIEAFEDTDCVVFTGGTSGITVCTYTGVDGLSILDKFIAVTAGG